MEQNIVVGLFEVESEAFQALTEFKQNPGTENSYLTAAALVKQFSSNSAASVIA